MTADRDSGALFDAAAALLLKRPGPELAALAAAFFGRAEEPGEAEKALEDWRDLFFAPSSGRYLPPFEAWFREKRLSGDIAAHALEDYRTAGFDPALLDMDPHWLSCLRPDHLGVELAFVAALFRGGSSPGADPGLERSARRFHARRVAPWAGEYGRALAASAGSLLYKDLGLLLEELAVLR